jgi:hypothetical protein
MVMALTLDVVRANDDEIHRHCDWPITRLRGRQKTVLALYANRGQKEWRDNQRIHKPCRRHLLASEIRQVPSTHLKDKRKRQGRSANLGQALSQFALFGELPHHKEPLSSTGKKR